MNKKIRLSFRRKNPQSLAKGTGGMNGCWIPSNEASKDDLIEFHEENMKFRRYEQRNRVVTHSNIRPTKNNNPEYRKSIWPDDKVR